MTHQHQEQAYADKLHQLAAAARKSPRAEVRQLWNPNLPWSIDKYGGRMADAETLQCRQSLLDALAKYGPLTGGKLSALLSGYGKRRRENAKTYLITSGEVTTHRTEDTRFLVFSLPEDRHHG